MTIIRWVFCIGDIFPEDIISRDFLTLNLLNLQLKFYFPEHISFHFLLIINNLLGVRDIYLSKR